MYTDASGVNEGEGSSEGLVRRDEGLLWKDDSKFDAQDRLAYL